jgi:hypothetical protein
VEIDIPAMPEDGPWLVMPESNNGAGIPKFSPLKELAAHLVAPDNPLFARNIVNRIWRQLMGRGLVEPLDLHHSGNPASHPELLEMLASEFVGHNFDIRWLVRELALTETFQRAGTLSGEWAYPPDDLFAVAIERPLSAEQLARAFLAATGEDRRVIDERGWDGIEGERYTAAEFEKAFLGEFGNAPKEPELEVKPSLKAALFLRNNELVLSCLKRRPGNLVDRVSGMTDAAQIAEELYLSILTRLPTEEEKLEVAAYLTHHAKERERSLGDYAWAMLSSIEFFTNH